MLNFLIFARGFRPFFFLGALFGGVLILYWGLSFGAGETLSPILADPVFWHVHEMIYGFAVAIIAGFLLTAVANWTGTKPVRGLWLAGLVALWGLGRLVMTIPLGLPYGLILVLSASFLPALALSLAVPLIGTKNRRNFIFLGLLSILFLCDVSALISFSLIPLFVSILVIIAMISLIGGRVVPAFTASALRQRGIEVANQPQPYLDILALVSFAGLIVALLFLGPQNYIFAAIAFFSALIHGLRLRRYHTLQALRDPMVWILHLGYGWVIIGLGLVGFAGLGWFNLSLAFHGFTVGAIGTMTLGMMVRVSLGHTGRKLHAGPWTVLAFFLMQFAALSRLVGPWLAPSLMGQWLMASALLWVAAFALYLLTYGPLLWQARPDGRPA